MASTLYQIILKKKKKTFLVKELKIMNSLDQLILFQFHQHVVQIFLKECKERL